MEIISYVMSGALAHRDNMGNGTAILPGDVQRMSAGRGVMHSEFNHDAQGQTHFLQIWIEPSQRGIDPGYEQKTFGAEDKRGRLCLVASPEGAQGSVTLHADARLYAGLFDGAEAFSLTLDAQRKTYVHLVRGQLQVNGQVLEAGDAAKLMGETRLQLQHGHEAEVLVFDLSA
jgi:redox-sensitive bicupin YhaK (pirin superfamily)